MTAAPFRERTPGGEPKAIRRAQRHLLIRTPEIGRLDRCTQAVGGKDPDRERNDQPVRQQCGYNRDPSPAEVTEPARLARVPNQDNGVRTQQKADREEQEPGQILAAGADGARVRDRKRCSFDGEDAERGGDRRPTARGQARTHGRREREHGERDEPAHEMVTGPGAVLGR